VDERRARTSDGRPLTVAAIIPHPDGLPEVLMSGRVGAAEGAWFWIGGHVRDGEEPADAALRELGEELEVDDPRAVRLLGHLDLHADVSATWGDGFERGFRVCYVLVALGSPRVRVLDHDELTVTAWKAVGEVADAVASLPAEIRAAAVRFAREAVAHPTRAE
jgi:8-oxo-dGTP pyrophosphatase MutT (NUDIX family)